MHVGISVRTRGKMRKQDMRIQGIEPWSVPWEGTMIPLHQMRLMRSAYYPFLYITNA